MPRALSPPRRAARARRITRTTRATAWAADRRVRPPLPTPPGAHPATSASTRPVPSTMRSKEAPPSGASIGASSSRIPERGASHARVLTSPPSARPPFLGACRCRKAPPSARNGRSCARRCAPRRWQRWPRRASRAPRRCRRPWFRCCLATKTCASKPAPAAARRWPSCYRWWRSCCAPARTRRCANTRRAPATRSSSRRRLSLRCILLRAPPPAAR